ncbi:SH3 domain-containing protein [Helicobacter sp. 11S03491-1]|uniref:SH3 domain-containing protein n=1 Tax=Helicobacter sp. 11S03491-1 TaxID=1476196 RepID=UPI000BA6BA78|nr:SH3 domain-containing protein [Helicobacter sp. 11S03491-1]PAF41688.1 hypothetical protein BKH45_06240 [Helicobacter sp. 11S03491-1]
MKKILYLFFCLYLLGILNIVCAQDDSSQNRAKIIYIKIPDSQVFNKPVYIGESIQVTYSLLLFSNARFVGTEFVGGIDTHKLVLKNPDTKWKLTSDGSYKAIYEYKIKSLDASIPPLKVMAISSDGDYSDSSIAPAINLNVIDLYQNQKYAGVVASEFDILGYKTKTYDNLNNILVFEAEARQSNLEDLKLPDIVKQGFESIHVGDESSDGIYYCIIPKNVQNISFEYFSLKDNRFKDVTLPIIASDDTISTQDDIKPKNNFLLFSNLVTVGFMIVFLILYFLLGRKRIFLIIFGLFLIYLLWNIFSRHEAVLLANKHIRILPTYNSTILETTKSNMEVEVIGKHDQYYKIVTNDDKVGWVNKNDVK